MATVTEPKAEALPAAHAEQPATTPEADSIPAAQPEQTASTPGPEAKTDPAAQPEQPALTAAQQGAARRHQEMWAIAMIKEASEINASLPSLPPAERHAASMRAAMLGSTANGLVNGAIGQPPRHLDTNSNPRAQQPTP